MNNPFSRFVNPNYQNNRLLQRGTMSDNNQYYQEQIKKMQELQRIKKIERLNSLEKQYGKDKIRDIVLGMDKKKDNTNNNDVRQKLKKMESDHAYDHDLNKNKELKSYYEGRTNNPYKTIIKDERYIKTFLEKPRPKDNQEKELLRKKLIVHKVTDEDKIGVNDDFNKFKGNIEKHNNELKVIYSTSKEAEHKKKFEYNHKYRCKVKYDPSDHNKLRKDKDTELKKEEKEKEIESKNMENIMKSLADNNIFSEDEIKNTRTINNRDKYKARQKNFKL